MLITLDKKSTTPLIEQIVNGVRERIESGALRQHTRLPSIRRFADQHGVSRFTVVQAFDRLVARGYLLSRPGSGFYVALRTTPHQNGTQPIHLDRAMDVLWLIRNALSSSTNSPFNAEKHTPGAGWFPHDWLDEKGIQRSLRQLAKRQGAHLTAYGCPEGYLPLRQHVQQRLDEIDVQASHNQIVLTNGGTHALDLIMRYYVRPNDTVIVDDPGYFILFGALQSLGARIIGVPWNKNGPDIQQLEHIIVEHQPKIFFTNSILHNPTGADISQAVAYRILQLAEKHNMVIIEDDVYSDLHPHQCTRLASLDQLNRIVYISSYSKTLSAAIRVGYIACNTELAHQLTDLKLLSGMTTSTVNERLIYQMLIEGYYRKHLDQLRKKIQIAKEKLLERFEQTQLNPYIDPNGGMFIAAEVPEHVNVVELANAASRKGITLAPGNLFRPHLAPSQLIRFNVASYNHDTCFEFIKRYVDESFS